MARPPPAIREVILAASSAYVLKMPREDVVALSQALVAVKDKVKHCPICYNVTDTVPCSLCRSPKRRQFGKLFYQRFDPSQLGL